MRKLFTALQTLLAIYPYVLLALLYAMGLMAADHLGYWPRPMLDDPTHYLQSNQLYTTLYDAIGWLAIPPIPWHIYNLPPPIMTFPLLSLLLLPVCLPGTPRRVYLFRLTCGLLGYFCLFCEPTELFAWWAD
jgi:hypothetical protein